MSIDPEAKANGYITCTECGRPVEAHDLNGCEESGCTVRWTNAEIRQARLDEGLPAVFHWMQVA